MEHFRSVGDAAKRTYRDNLNAIQRATWKQQSLRLCDDCVARLFPFRRDRDIEWRSRDRFVNAPRLRIVSPVYVKTGLILGYQVRRLKSYPA